MFKYKCGLKTLSESLLSVKTPRFEEIADVCVGQTEGFDGDKRIGLSYVLALTFEYGSDGNYLDEPCYKINQALLNGSLLSLACVKDLLWGVFVVFERFLISSFSDYTEDWR